MKIIVCHSPFTAQVIILRSLKYISKLLGDITTYILAIHKDTSHTLNAFFSLINALSLADNNPKICYCWAAIRGGFGNNFLSSCCNISNFPKYSLASHNNWITISIYACDHIWSLQNTSYTVLYWQVITHYNIQNFALQMLYYSRKKTSPVKYIF